MSQNSTFKNKKTYILKIQYTAFMHHVLELYFLYIIIVNLYLIKMDFGASKIFKTF